MTGRLLPNRQYKSGMRWCLLRWTDVDPEGSGEIYLTRLHIVQTPWFSIMLHWLRRADPQPDLHDHPNDFISLVLRGGYSEERETRRGYSSSRDIRFFNIMKAEDRHKILSVKKSTITLVFANKVRRNWGFWRNDRFIDWRRYNHLNDDA
jgi:hypothetical protein